MSVQIITLPNNNKVIYWPESQKLFLASETVAKAAVKITSGEPVELVLEQCRELQPKTAQHLLSCQNQNDIYTRNPSEKESQPNPSKLKRLVINISNDCNMRCGYCYASGGCYGEKRGFMALDTLNQALSLMYSIFQEIETIQLFGGEPTLNMHAIKHTCEWVTKRNKCTKIGIVTNGTCASEDFIRLINKYDISLTVSIDTYELQRSLRPLANHHINSYSVISENVKRLLEMTGEPSQFELTYTAEHVRRNISIMEILQQLHSEYGSVPVHITPVCSDDEKYRLKSFRPFVDSIPTIFSPDFLATGATPYSIALGYANALRNRLIQDSFCSAGVNTLAVSTQGDIYPCFYFIGNNSFKISSVFENQLSVQQKLAASKSEFSHINKRGNNDCSNCVAKTLCHGCIGMNYSETGNPSLQSAIRCTLTKGIVTELIKSFAMSNTTRSHEQ